MVVDRLGTFGIELVPPSPTLRAKMMEFNINLGHRRVIDLTMAGTATGVYGAALEVLLREPNLDAVLAVVGSSAQFHPEVAVQPIINAPKTGMPLAVFLVPQADTSLDILQKAGIAAFRTPESCADGVRALMDWKPPANKVRTKNLDAAMHLIKQTKGHILRESEAADIFAAIGVPMAPSVQLANPYAKIDLDLDFPLAAKVLSEDLPHKTEAGAVALNITDLKSLRTQAITIWESALHFNPKATLDGILIQPMIFGLAEALVGFRRDPETGPIVILSTGGVLAEIYSDAAIRLAPVNLNQAQEMIDEVQGLAPIRGYRNLPRGDLKALAECIRTVSQFAAIKEPNILEAEINPLNIAKDGYGVIAVDAFIRLAS